MKRRRPPRTPLAEQLRRSAELDAIRLERQAALTMTEARAKRAAADRYAEALRALGQGDKLPELPALPNYAGLGERT